MQQKPVLHLSSNRQYPVLNYFQHSFLLVFCLKLPKASNLNCHCHCLTILLIQWFLSVRSREVTRPGKPLCGIMWQKSEDWYRLTAGDIAQAQRTLQIFPQGKPHYWIFLQSCCGIQDLIGLAKVSSIEMLLIYIDTQTPEECLFELKKDQQLGHGLLTTETKSRLSQIINCKKFGSFERFITVTLLVLKFCRRLLVKVCDASNSNDSFDPQSTSGTWNPKKCSHQMSSLISGRVSLICSKMVKEYGGAKGESRMLWLPTLPNIQCYCIMITTLLFWSRVRYTKKSYTME